MIGHEAPTPHPREPVGGRGAQPRTDRPAIELQRAMGNRAFARAVLARDTLFPDFVEPRMQEYAPVRQSSLARGGPAMIGGQAVWVTGPGAQQPPPDNAYPVVTEHEYWIRLALWESLERGSGRITIETAPAGGAPVPGFRERILRELAILIMRPAGERLVHDLNFGARRVTIRPSARRLRGGAVTAAEVGTVRPGERLPNLYRGNGTPGPGTDSTISVDPTVADDSVVVTGVDGAEVETPVYILLGHELIHARHNAQGRSEGATAAFDVHDDTAEESRTIDHPRITASDELPEITENALRAEHVIGARRGHGARDLRFPR